MKRFVLIVMTACMLLSTVSALAAEGSWPPFLDKNDYREAGLYNDRMHYVNKDTGETAVMIDVGDTETIWLKEESGGRTAWFGLDNSNGTFDAGSCFYVRWLDQNTASDTGTWNNFYSQLDSRTKAEAGHLWLFDVGVRDSSGNLTEFANPFSLSIQLEDGWDLNDLHSCFITSGADIQVLVSTAKLEEPEDLSGTYAVMQLTHFSPYALYDLAAPAAPAVPQTGDAANMVLWFGLASASAIAMVLIVRRRRNA